MQTIQELPTLLAQFHFLRSQWLLALLPVMALAGWYLVQIRNQRPPIDEAQKQWINHVDSHLLPYLVIGQTAYDVSLDNDPSLQSSAQQSKPSSKVSHWLLPLALFASLLAAIIGMAGPTWQQKPVPVVEGNTPTMIVLSLAQSMNANDVKPTRLQRAVHKIRDILEQTEGDQRGLVIYSDVAFTASPLTNDTQVIQKMLPELSTSLMPVLGNRLDLAVDKATELLQRGGALQGNIIVLTDGAGDDVDKSLSAVTRSSHLGYRVSVLGVGTEAGALLRVADGRSVNDNNGDAVQTKLDVASLTDLASAGGGVFHELTAANQDVKALLNNQGPQQGDPFNIQGQTSKNETNAWVDMGFWLLLIPMILMPFAFKRGAFSNIISGASSVKRNRLLAAAVPMVFCGSLGMGLLGSSQNVYAESSNTPTSEFSKQSVASPLASAWHSLWQTTRQQAQEAFDKGDFQQAAKLFGAAKSSDNTQSWQASSLYKAKDYQQAAKGFQQQKQDYNLGNALAKSGEFQEAIEAYDRHLKVNPDDEDAKFNHDLVKKLLDEQQKNQQDKQDGEDGQDGKDGQDSQDGQESQDEQGNQNDQKDGQDGEQPQDPSNDQQDESGKGQDGEPKDEAGDNPKDESGDETGSDANEAGEAADKDAQAGDAKQAFNPQPLDQATEQALRRVPDDSSGLLRARIMQYYRQQQQSQQQGN